MILFRLPSIQSQAHKLMIWGYETTWSQSGRWDHAPIAWHFEKALHETTFDRESTRIHPITSRSTFAAEILSSLKKSTLSLKKLHARHVELFCVAKLKGEDDKYFIEGTSPSWVKLLRMSGQSDQATLTTCNTGEWFSFEHQPLTSVYVVRTNIDECPHQFEISEPSVCRFEPLLEWLTSITPLGIGFDPEELP
jgi:hypothetical protein